MFLSHIVIAGTFLTIFITICRDLIKGTAKHYKLPLIGLVAAMIVVMLEVTEVYRVVSLSGIFIAIGLVVLLVVTLIQTMDRIRELELARQKEARESLDYLTGLPMRHKGETLIIEKCRSMMAVWDLWIWIISRRSMMSMDIRQGIMLSGW